MMICVKVVNNFYGFYKFKIFAMVENIVSTGCL